MEEIIAKTAKKLYLITYPITLVLGLLFIGVGAFLSIYKDVGEAGWIVHVACAVIVLVAGGALVIISIVYIIYFAKMSANAITFKDGKLYFSNGVVCSPAEVNHCRAAGMGPDGAIFGFGKVFVTVNGKEYKIKYVQNAGGAVSRIYMLIAQYQVRQNIANRQAAQQSAQSQNETQEDK